MKFNKKYFANLGVERNKKPLQNIIFWFTKKEDSEEYLCQWQYEKWYNRNQIKNWSGYVKEDYIKQWLSPNQWSKFKQGETKFIVQRRIDGKNTPKVSRLIQER